MQAILSSEAMPIDGTTTSEENFMSSRVTCGYDLYRADYGRLDETTMAIDMLFERLAVFINDRFTTLLSQLKPLPLL